MNYTDIMAESSLTVRKDGIIVKSTNNHPTCPNAVYQDLLERQQRGELLDRADENLYSYCIMTLIEIVLNNKHYKFQKPEVKTDLRAAMTDALILGVPMSFDGSKGSSLYSYAFRSAYNAGTKVLNRYNKERAFQLKASELVDNFMASQNAARKTVRCDFD